MLYNKEPSLKNARSMLINLFVALVAVSLFFGALELYSRWRYFQGTKLADTGFATREGFTPPVKRAPLRIVCIGGSTTYGYYVARDESYPAYLETILNKRFGRRIVEVQNSGLPARNTAFLKDYVKKRIGQQELDLLLVDCIYNDFKDFFPFFYDPFRDSQLTEDNRLHIVGTRYNWKYFNLPETLNLFLSEHSYFYSRFREKLLMARYRGKTLGEIYQLQAAAAQKRRGERPAENFIVTVPDIKQHDMSTEAKRNAVIESYFRRYRENTKEIIVAAKARAVAVVLISPPYPLMKYSVWKGVLSNSDVSDEYYRKVFYGAKAILKELAEKHGLLLIDNDEALTRRGRNEEFFFDAVHLSPQGNLMIAELIADQLEPYLKTRFAGIQ